MEHHDHRWTQYRPELFLLEQLERASPALMREMLATFINALLSAQADTVCADYGARTQGRTNRRNGYRHRDLDVCGVRLLHHDFESLRSANERIAGF